jgi:hypothetical protein
LANFTGRVGKEKFSRFALVHQEPLTNHADIGTGAANITLTTNILTTATATCVAAFPTDGFSRIVGTVRAQRDSTLKIYQGLGPDSLYNEVTAIAITGSVSAGAGQRFNVPVLGDTAKITITNDSGSTMSTLSFEAFLVSLDPGVDTDAGASVSIVSPVGAGTAAAAVRATLASDDPAVTALQIIDDWDESDRAKTNIIVGQAGITAGAGVVAANTPRVTHASDDPAVALLTTIDADTSALAGAVSGTEMQVDILTTVLPAASAASTGAWSRVVSTAQEASHVIKASAGRLRLLTGYNAKASAQFIQVHNTTSVPADTAVPVYSFTVPASSNFSLDLGETGAYFSTGISVCNSSTQPTKTVGTTDTWFTAEYL